MQINVMGNGPACVMIHGWAMHSGIFQNIAAVLKNYFTLYLIDLPGHGQSSESPGEFNLHQTTQQIVDATPPAIWLGWSLGGLFALYAARHHAHHVRGLVALNSSPCFVKNTSWPYGVSIELFQRFAHELAQNYQRTLKRFLLLECHGSDCAEIELRTLKKHIFQWGEPTLSTLTDGLSILSNTDLRNALSYINCPGLWIAGGKDQLVPWRGMQWACEQMPRSEWLLFNKAGHAPFIGHANEVITAIQNFSTQL